MLDPLRYMPQIKSLGKKCLGNQLVTDQHREEAHVFITFSNIDAPKLKQCNQKQGKRKKMTLKPMTVF